LSAEWIPSRVLSLNVAGLLLTRALGDHFPKQQKLGLVCDPYLTDPIEIRPSDRWLIVATDGVCDFSFDCPPPRCTFSHS
jgi:serine/threonine protein phosphatase PrpC